MTRPVTRFLFVFKPPNDHSTRCNSSPSSVLPYTPRAHPRSATTPQSLQQTPPSMLYTAHDLHPTLLDCGSAWHSQSLGLSRVIRSKPISQERGHHGSICLCSSRVVYIPAVLRS
ncbi:hypothetical protein PsYK624_062640 [Phanerochaete sordida]|uniref:Uncharacterized protein n=1 Tax=Phanerochaete sordida TaxID=48140 RepID=A0A9P3G908_9APHY|nr:hypothetical protein PsYK624_062640 [Phanerochaete sordida]